VAVALSAVLGVAFRRTRKALMRILHIDEGAGRAVEPAVSRIDPSGEARGRRRLPRGALRCGRRPGRGQGAPVSRPALGAPARALASHMRVSRPYGSCGGSA
jgi:hypothetical protein